MTYRFLGHCVAAAQRQLVAQWTIVISGKEFKDKCWLCSAQYRVLRSRAALTCTRWGMWSSWTSLLGRSCHWTDPSHGLEAHLWWWSAWSQTSISLARSARSSLPVCCLGACPVRLPLPPLPPQWHRLASSAHPLQSNEVLLLRIEHAGHSMGQCAGDKTTVRP